MKGYHWQQLAERFLATSPVEVAKLCVRVALHASKIHRLVDEIEKFLVSPKTSK
jgi:hypothetical protein